MLQFGKKKLIFTEILVIRFRFGVKTDDEQQIGLKGDAGICSTHFLLSRG